MKYKENSVLEQIQFALRKEKQDAQAEKLRSKAEEDERQRLVCEARNIQIEHERASLVVVKSTLDSAKGILESILSEFTVTKGFVAQLSDFDYFFWDHAGYKASIRSLKNPRYPLSIEIVGRIQSEDTVEVDVFCAEYTRTKKMHQGDGNVKGKTLHDTLVYSSRELSAEIGSIGQQKLELIRQQIWLGIENWLGNKVKEEMCYIWKPEKRM